MEVGKSETGRVEGGREASGRSESERGGWKSREREREVARAMRVLIHGGSRQPA